MQVIALATASTIAKMASGVADNMLATSYLSARAQVLVAPAMDLDMMAHPSTVREHRHPSVRMEISSSSQRLASLPATLIGKGRMEEPESHLQCPGTVFLFQPGHGRGKKVLITAGPTYEKIDPVRFIGNYSSGKMGYAIAAEACQAWR